MDSPQPDSSLSGQWASGRTLTKSQRERKRAIDRKRISKRREQNTERIAVLEAKLAQVTAELEALKRTKAPESASAVGEPNAQCDPLTNTPNTPEILHDVPWADTTLGIPPVPSTPIGSIGTTGSIQSCADVNIDILSNSPTQPILPNELSAPQLADEVLSLGPYIEGPILPSSSDRSQEPDCQRIFSRAVRKTRAITAADVCIDPVLNEDALIRGVIHGWSDVQARSEFFCPLWEILEVLDRRIFLYSGTLTRLPCLKMIHSLLLVSP